MSRWGSPEAALCTPRKGVTSCARRAHSINLCPRGGQESRSRHRGVVGVALDAEFELLAGRVACFPHGPADGPDYLFGGHFDFVSGGGCSRDVGGAVDFCLSGPVGSGPCSPGPAQLQLVNAEVQQPVPSTLTPGSACISASEGYADSSPRLVDGNATTEHAAVQAATMPVEDFISAFRLPLAQPVLSSTPGPRVTRAEKARVLEEDELIPKRSARLPAKSKYRAARPEAQARKVTMKRLVLRSRQIFSMKHPSKLPLSPSTREAMQVLFPGRKQQVSRTVRAA